MAGDAWPSFYRVLGVAGSAAALLGCQRQVAIDGIRAVGSRMEVALAATGAFGEVPHNEVVEEALKDLDALYLAPDGSRSLKMDRDWGEPGSKPLPPGTDIDAVKALSGRIARLAECEQSLVIWNPWRAEIEDGLTPLSSLFIHWSIYPPTDPSWNGISRYLHDLVQFGAPHSSVLGMVLVSRLLQNDSIPLDAKKPLVPLAGSWPRSLVQRAIWEVATVVYQQSDSYETESLERISAALLHLEELASDRRLLHPGGNEFWESLRERSHPLQLELAKGGHEAISAFSEISITFCEGADAELLKFVTAAQLEHQPAED